MLARVEAATREIGQVDPADEGDAVVDEHELLVVAVERPLLRVELNADAPAPQPRGGLAHLRARRPEERQRRARPDEDAHVDVEGGEQLGERRPAGLQAEPRIDVPACDVHVRARSSQCVGDRRQRLGAVDEEANVVARTRWPGTLRPTAGRRIEGALVAAPG